MDYIVEYSVNGEIKMEVVSLDDFIPSEVIEDFIKDKLYDLEEFEQDSYENENKPLEIDILHIELLRDYNVDIYKL